MSDHHFKPFHYLPEHVSGTLRSLDRLFQHAFSEMANHPMFKEPTFPVHVQETEKEILIVAKLPNIEKDQIKIDAHETYVRIAVFNTEEIEQENKQTNALHYFATRQIKERVVPLSFPIDIDEARANFEDGTLTITIPKGKGSITIE